MRCGQFHDWLRELTASPTPVKIANYLQGELQAVEAEAGGGDESPVRRHLKRCARCHGRVRRALKYWSLIGFFCRDVTPGPGLERRLAERIQADLAAPALGRLPASVGPRAAVRAAEAATSEEELSLYREAGGERPALGWVLTLAGPHAGAYRTLAPGENSVGSDPSCDVSLDDASVATRHALIVCAVSAGGASYYLLDLGSESGTFLNGSDEPLRWVRLEDNDVIRVGCVRLKFKALAGAPAAS
jgi:hypothetical protein